MMTPTSPSAYFVIRKAGFAFSALDTILYAMFCFDNTCQFLQRRIRMGVGKMIVVLHLTALGGPLDQFRGLLKLVLKVTGVN